MSQTLKSICYTLSDALRCAPKSSREEEQIHRALRECFEQAAAQALDLCPTVATEQAMPAHAATLECSPADDSQAQLIERIQQLEQENQQLKQQLSSTEQVSSEALSEASSSAYENLCRIFWPDYLRLPELEPYHEQWEASLLGQSEDESLRCMFASIFMWDSYVSMAKLEADMDSHVMNSLQNISRFFFSWAESIEITSYDALHLARLISERLNVILEQRGFLYSIYLPELDMPYVSSSMQPSVKGERTGDVVAVQAWGLYNQRGNLYPRKCIVTLSNEPHASFI